MKKFVLLAAIAFLTGFASGCATTFSGDYETVVVVDPYYTGPYWVDNGWYYYYKGGFFMRFGKTYRFHHFVSQARRHQFDEHWQNDYLRSGRRPIFRRVPRRPMPPPGRHHGPHQR